MALNANYLEDISAREAVEDLDDKECTAPSNRDTQESASSRALHVEICGPEIAPGLLLTAELIVTTPFECLAYERAFRPEIIPRLNHAVVRSGRQLLGIFSYYPRGKTLVVVNRLIRLPDDVLAVCAAKMLSHHPSMRSVEFGELYNGTGTAPDGQVRSYTWATIDCAEAELPRSYAEYLQIFGSSTRKNLRYCARRLERESPSVAFRIVQGAEFTDDTVAAVVQLNRLRMASKGKASGMNEVYAARLAALSRSHGVGCIATEGTRIVAGTLCTRVGSGWTLHVIAHDPKFNHVRLGLLCLLKSVEEAIGSGATRFNFLWGASDYKILFGGKIRTLRARRYYRNMNSQLLAFADIRDRAVQTLARHLVLWRRAYRRAAGA
jgi:hypothetical protein